MSLVNNFIPANGAMNSRRVLRNQSLGSHKSSKTRSFRNKLQESREQRADAWMVNNVSGIWGRKAAKDPLLSWRMNPGIRSQGPRFNSRD